MKVSEARALDEQGKLSRKVLTDQGWYIPQYTPATAPIASPEPRILPPIRPRKQRAKKEQ